MRLIDKFLPRWDFSKRHYTPIMSNSDSIISQLQRIDFSKSPIIRMLFMLRGLPKQMLTLKSFFDVGFVVLEESNTEIVIGLIGQPWKIKGNIRAICPAEFMQFNEADHVKVAWNFIVETVDEKSRILSTETRIFCTSKQAKTKFSLYWSLIGFFSRIIRNEMLKIIKEEIK